MSIIQNKDIYDPSKGNPFKPILEMLDILDQKIESTKKHMVGLESTLRSVNKTGSGAEAKIIIENTTKLNAETERLNALTKAELQIRNQLAASTQKLALIEDGYTKELTEQKLKIQEASKAEKEQIILATKLGNEYKKLSIEYNRAAKAAKDLAAKHGITSKEAMNAAKSASILGDKLKAIDASVRQYGRNVGNYTSAWQGFGASLKQMFIAGGIVGLATMALNKIKDIFRSSVDESQQAQKAYAKVEQAIKSTGGAAGFSAIELKTFADQIEDATNIDADKIFNDVTAQLLTFTNVQGEEFKRAQKAALDLSTVLGSDLKGTTIQLGKALQDPIKGITALQRSGVSFTQSQRDLIKSLVETGKSAEAQRLILKELENQYGGQAEAASKAGLGPLEKLGIIWDNIKESLGNVLIPLINKFATVIGQAFESFTEWIDNAMVYMVDFINGWIELYNESMAFRVVVQSITSSFNLMWESVKLVFSLIIDNLKGMGMAFGYAFNPKNWGAGFQEGLKNILFANADLLKKDVKNYGKDIAKDFQEGIKNVTKGKASLLSLSSKKPESKSIGGIVSDQDIDQNIKNVKTNETDWIREYLDKQKAAQAHTDFIKSQEDQMLADERAYNDAIKIEDNAKWEVLGQQAEEYEKKLREQRAESINYAMALGVMYTESEEEMFAKRKELLLQSAIESAEILGQLIGEGELSIKSFSKFLLTTALDVAEKMVLLSIGRIWAESVAQGLFAGIAKAAILTALVKGVFAGIKSQVQGFAEGTEYVNGAGTEKSDSIHAKLSKGERVVPAEINKQLMGISNKDLPKIINNGINTIRLEKLLNKVDQNTSMSAYYLSNLEIHHEDGKYRYYKDVKTGVTHRIIKD